MSINLVQNLNVEVDSIEYLKKYLELALPTILDSTQEIAIKIIDHDNEYKSLYYPSSIYNKKDILPILLIEGWYKPKDNKENSFFNGYKPWKSFTGDDGLRDSINYIITFLETNKKVLDDRFFSDFGDGYSYEFNKNDGSINSGFQLISAGTFPNSLCLSLVHIYYGK